MNIDPRQTSLFKFLEQNNKAYYGKILELRDVVQGWLNYIPNTFPHYTRHTVEHSDNIISQISYLTFKDNGEPVLNFSSIEVYVLLAAAYLHDAGMVVSDAEKAEILKTDAWKEWTETENGGGTKRWREIVLFRNGNSPSDNGLRNFLADVHTRHLIADYIRRGHHLRTAQIMSQHQLALSNFSFGDPAVLTTISNVCVAHGLSQYELEDEERFPGRRNLQHEQIDVRLMAILL